MAAEKQISELNNLNIKAATQDGTTPEPQKKEEASCCASLKMFLVALCFSYFVKAYAGSYVKSSITQIERRFDISSSTVGMVDGSFEFGNLLVIAFVSYFGAKFHRPRIIAAGCFLMALGSFLTALPHFFMGPYKYEATRTQVIPPSNSTGAIYSISPCLANRTLTEGTTAGCVKETSSYMWVYVLVGNLLRGIGETPIAPLGISYIDDFAGTENTPLYIACLHTISMFGPMAGFMLSSLFAKLYVDIGFVDLAGIPAPIYFGALIDRTCLKWGTKLCGGRGACRLYNTHAFRSTFLGLTAGIRAPSFILFLIFISMVKKKFSVKNVNEQENGTKKPEIPEEGGKGGADAPEIEKQTFI
ncbi:solute carrier organic anion transporter family member 1B3-like [Anomaloglossus baeobatrachus]|uniref:solute carrier organic anion transporter family member 1B3-like n=1 Tax=Anomaloglossus baeobatrachus TaxID=238106 RepID=UPI003F502075